MSDENLKTTENQNNVEYLKNEVFPGLKNITIPGEQGTEPGEPPVEAKAAPTPEPTTQKVTAAASEQKEKENINKEKLNESSEEFFFDFESENPSENDKAADKEPKEPAFSDQDITRYLQGKGLKIESIEDLLKPAQVSAPVVSDDLLKLQDYLNKGGSFEQYLKLQRDFTRVDRQELIRDYLKEAENLTDKSINFRLKNLQTMPIKEDDLLPEELESLRFKNEAAEVQEEEYYNKALNYFEQKKKDLTLSFAPPSEQEIIAKQSEIINKYYNTLDKGVQSISQVEIKDEKGKTLFKNTYTDQDKRDMNELAKTANDFINSHFDENQELRVDKAPDFQENIAWANPNFRNKKIMQIAKAAWAQAIEYQSKEKRNVTLDKMNGSNKNPVNLPDGFDKNFKAAFPNIDIN